MSHHGNSNPPIPTPTTYADDVRNSDMLRQGAVTVAKRNYIQRTPGDTDRDRLYTAEIRQGDIDHLLRCRASAIAHGDYTQATSLQGALQGLGYTV